MTTARFTLALALTAALLLAVGCVPPPEPVPLPPPPTAQELEQGVVTQALWFGQMHQGRATTSGEDFDMRKLTASHATLALGTRLEVRNPANGRSALVTVNDRGFLEPGDELGLSAAAAQALGIQDRRRSTVVYRLAR